MLGLRTLCKDLYTDQPRPNLGGTLFCTQICGAIVRFHSHFLVKPIHLFLNFISMVKSSLENSILFKLDASLKSAI